MSEKTKQTIWFEESNRELPEGIYPGMADDKIYNAMQIYADQQVRGVTKDAVIQQWEGLTITENVEVDRLIHEIINQYGALGWEFCQWLPAKDTTCIYIFKRHKI